MSYCLTDIRILDRQGGRHGRPEKGPLMGFMYIIAECRLFEQTSWNQKTISWTNSTRQWNVCSSPTTTKAKCVLLPFFLNAHATYLENQNLEKEERRTMLWKAPTSLTKKKMNKRLNWLISYSRYVAWTQLVGWVPETNLSRGKPPTSNAEQPTQEKACPITPYFVVLTLLLIIPTFR